MEVTVEQWPAIQTAIFHGRGWRPGPVHLAVVVGEGFLFQGDGLANLAGNFQITRRNLAPGWTAHFSQDDVEVVVDAESHDD